MKLNVLITDDDDSVLFLHRIMIRENDLSSDPLTFLSGGETLAHIQENAENGEPYLVLLDLNMPVMSGWEFLEALNELDLPIPVYVVIVTSSVDAADRERANIFPQVIDYIEKPVNKTSLERLKKSEELKEFFYEFNGKGI